MKPAFAFQSPLVVRRSPNKTTTHPVAPMSAKTVLKVNPNNGMSNPTSKLRATFLIVFEASKTSLEDGTADYCCISA